MASTTRLALQKTLYLVNQGQDLVVCYTTAALYTLLVHQLKHKTGTGSDNATLILITNYEQFLSHLLFTVLYTHLTSELTPISLSITFNYHIFW